MEMEKIFKGLLILNWKSGKMEVRKKGKRVYSPFEIPVRVEISVKIPEKKEIVAKGDITLSEEQVKKMVIEAL